MGTDYAKIRQRFAARQKALADMDEKWVKFDQGRHKVRICPPLANHDSWFVEYGVHYGIGDEFNPQTVTCPRLTVQKACPICEFVRGLWRSGDEGDKDLARKIGAKRRYCSNVIVLSNPNETRVWAYGPQVWDQLAELCVGEGAEGGVIPIDDPDNGFNMSVVVTTRNTPDGTYPNYMVRNEMKPTPIVNKKVLSTMSDIKEMIHKNLKPYDEIRAILTGGEVPENAEATEASQSEVQQPETEKVVTDEPETEKVVETQQEEVTDGGQVEEKATSQDLVRRARAALSKRGPR
jgi:hypothetical protein